MTTRLYLHDATSADTGTLPGGTNVYGLTVTTTATGASTNRSMDTTPGATQVGPTVSSGAVTTTQTVWWRRYLSAPLAAQTIGSATVTWKGQMAIKTASSSISAWQASMQLSVWRPSTGAKVGTYFDAIPGAVFATTAEALVGVAGGCSSGSFTTVACSDGDVLVCEISGSVTQGMATAELWTLYYDGTTDDSITSDAAYLTSPTTLTFLTAGAAAPSPIQPVLQAVQRASVY